MKYVRWTLIAVLSLIVVLLAIANRDEVVLSINPLDRADAATSLVLPLFLVILLSIFIGILIGWAASTLKARARRRRA
ncbi:MAG: hypothetical protein PW790_01530 [Parvibaculaceae bacterium]|nr:hypothetical protein [Parvibaculaceae bacterium]